MKQIVITGSGFSGLATAIQLIEQLNQPVRLCLINPSATQLTGVAYQPHKTHLLLNVNAARMSLYPDKPGHFLDWVMQQPDYQYIPQQVMAQTFLPRALYGSYLQHNWQQSLQTATAKNIDIIHYHQDVIHCRRHQQQFQLTLDNQQKLSADILILANGNHLPGDKVLPDPSFASSPYYVKNPWHPAAFTAIPADKPVLIIGNGLTMVDTVLSLRQQGFRQQIIAVSPHGYNILPHRHPGISYPDFSAELLNAGSLRQLVTVVRSHIRRIRQLGISAEPVIDAIRPYTQQLWRSLSLADKRRFMSRVRHLWGVARHRLPLHIADQIQQLRTDGLLKVYAGRVLSLQQNHNSVTACFSDKKTGQAITADVGRIFNCTGPETDLQGVPRHVLSQMLQDGLLQQDPLRLGIRADTTSFRVLDSNNQPHTNLYTLGSNLKGELWESTAVNELRTQAAKLAASIIRQLS